jgi:hypothetical protein
MTTKRKITTIALVALAFAVTLGLLVNRSADAKINNTTAAAAAGLSAQQFFYNGVGVYALGANNNTLYLLNVSTATFNRVGAIAPVNGTVAECDFRPLNSQLYCVTDNGNSYLVNPANAQATLVGTLSPSINSGTALLYDFNPMADAIRYIGANNLNYAVVKDANGNFNTVAVQTPVAFAAGDINQGNDPNLVAGAYSQNQPNRPVTLFYAIDSNANNIVTIANKNATGSSNTGGGSLQTVGKLYDQNGLVILGANSGYDIATYPNLGFLDIGWILSGGVSGGPKITTFFNVQINPNLPIGQVQNVGGTSLAVTASDGNVSFGDIMITPPGQ